MAHSATDESRRPTGNHRKIRTSTIWAFVFVLCTHEKEHEAAAVLDTLRKITHVDRGQVINLITLHDEKPNQQDILRTSKNPWSPWTVRKSFVMIAFGRK